jgi:hypothetical protein
MARFSAPAKKDRSSKTAKLFIKAGPLQKFGAFPYERTLLMG